MTLRAATPPNIIFILADDLGYGDLGCYGQKIIQTPRLDQMAAEGMKFTQFYAGSTVCAPSRCVLMTGFHTGHAFIRGNGRVNLRPEDITVAEVLKSAGYTTGLVGKWGLGLEETTGHPLKQGFDTFFGYLNQGHAHNYYPTFLYRNETRISLRNQVPNEGPAGQGLATLKLDYSHDLFIDEAMEFLNRARHQPFFLYLALTIPHANNEANRAVGNGQEVPDFGPYADLDWPDPDKGQAAMITRMDRDVGRILDYLKANHLHENTLVMFSSDNGPHKEGGNDPRRFQPGGPLRGMKRDLYEGGIRVPMIAWWPGTVPANSTSDHVGYFGDLMATAADLAGVEAPSGRDGVSFVQALKGKKNQQHDHLYWEFYEGAGGKQAVRQGPWKAIRQPAFQGKTELFRLDSDLGETRDISADHPEVVNRLESLMAENHIPSPLWKTGRQRVRLDGNQPGQDRKPNVVLIMTDDQGYGDIGAHGNSMIRTPHLDRLHQQSVRFTQFHVDPTCSPTRSALMTGRYSTRTGVWHTIRGRSLMRGGERTLAEYFKEGGYRTGIFGKWHLGDNHPMRPQDQGFEQTVVAGGGGVGQTPDYWGNDYFDDTYWHNGVTRPNQGYCTDVFFNEALRFVEAHREEPFLVYLPTNVPHGPYLVEESYTESYLKQGVNPTMAKFYGMITEFDENLGRFRAKLMEWGLEENTIFIFMTDNGTAAGISGPQDRAKYEWPGFNAGMRGQKGSEYDGGHRVPFFVYWPKGGITGGRDVGNLAAHIDVVPTLMDLCGIKVEARDQALWDGVSLAPLCKDPGAPWLDRSIPVHSQRIEYPKKWKTSSVMTQQWRLVNGTELYDIQEDLGQKRNVASEHPGLVDILRSNYDVWWSSLEETFDVPAPINLGHPAENPCHLTCHDWHSDQVPWNQGMVARDPEANGYWVVNVVQDGRYRVTLRRRPAQVNAPLQAEWGSVRVGDLESGRVAVEPGASSVSIEMNLKAGVQNLETQLGEKRGAFFVEIERIGEP